jgi:hypothetical protein
MGRQNRSDFQVWVWVKDYVGYPGLNKYFVFEAQVAGRRSEDCLRPDEDRGAKSREVVLSECGFLPVPRAQRPSWRTRARLDRGGRGLARSVAVSCGSVSSGYHYLHP